MAVALTGGTGLVGSAVLRALVASGHEVVALVRSQQSAEAVTAAGATAAIGELTDVRWVREQFAAADGAIHTASPGDASSADFDRGVVEAAVAAYAGTGKRYVHTGGVWVHGAGRGITEQTPNDAPALTAWRQGVEQALLGADVNAAVLEPGIVYAGRQGLPGILATPDEQGRYHLVGDGSQHWTTVHADDLAALYALVYDADVTGYVLGVGDDAPTVRELVEAAAGGAEVVAETPEQSRDRLGAPLTDALLLDQVASNALARSLGWAPTARPLTAELRAR